MTTTKKTECIRADAKTTKHTSKPKPSKKARLETMLSRPRGATQFQLEKALGWQPHSVRAAISRLRAGGTRVLLDRGGRAPTYRVDTAS